MKYEKSCGAVIFRRASGIEYLIILNKKGNASGHWGFPKGHTEGTETELMTAKREIYEETGLTPNFIDGFRAVTTYSPFKDTLKDVVYFLAENLSGDVTIQKSELSDFKWCSFDEASKLLTFDKKLLEDADRFLKKNA